MIPRRAAVMLLALLLCALGLSAQEIEPKTHYYDVDKEISLVGTVQRIIMEPRKDAAAPFMKLEVRESKSDKIYTVEVSPSWFFSEDVHQGEQVNITGSLVSAGELNLVMARQVRFRGEIFNVRDKHGFPNWRGGRGRQKGRIKR